jgi:hypothetical protein
MGSYLYKDFYPPIPELVPSSNVTSRMLDNFGLLEGLPRSELAFVFEIARHGARAPLMPDTRYSNDFKVEPGMLTASGMRQRRLLGEYNMKRYSIQYGL